MSFLSSLRNKPAHVKSRIAVLGAILFTGIVGVVWTSTLPVRFAELEEGLEKGAEGTATAKNALTDLVAEVEMTPPQVDQVVPKETDPSSFFQESALDRLAGERFDPTQAPKAEEGETASPTPGPSPSTTPPPTSPSEVVPKPDVAEPPQEPLPQAEEPQPRVILIGTTTKSTP